MAPTTAANAYTPANADLSVADAAPEALHPAAAAVACRRAADADGPGWDAFVGSQAAANLGHLFAWKRVVEGAYGKRAYYLTATAGGQWLGVLPLVHMRGPLTGNRLVSLPFLDQAGVLAVNDASRAALREAAFALAREVGARSLELRGAAPEGAPQADRSTLVLPLPESADALWKSFSPKVRNQVRKSEKEGLRTEPADRERLNDFYRVFTRNMRDLGSPVHGLRFLRAVFETLPDSSKLYLTRDAQQRIVGGAIAIAFQGTVTVPWASSLREVFSACPNHSLYWRILADATAARAQRFDFGRSHVDSGTYRFKTQWGAAPRPLRWQSVDPAGNEAPPQVLKPAEHQKLTAVWSRLPLWLANRLGPLIRRQLSN